ncbi:MAG TPA: FMN-binding protein [Pseudomonadota bacterium]|nr:FMN-binding protein [Pseudomonadota bacterium]
MKVIFNWLLPMSSQRLRFGPCLCLLWALASPAEVRAQATYFTPRALLAEFFPKSQLVTYQKFELSAAQRSRVESLLGYGLKKTSYTLYIAKTGEHVDGYAILDEENGQHLPISFAVKLSPSGAVERQEIMVYRERYGDEVRDPRFRQQFVGKTAADPLRPGEEVIAVSGATISSRAMALGVRRALVLFDELVLRPIRDAAAAH